VSGGSDESIMVRIEGGGCAASDRCVLHARGGSLRSEVERAHVPCGGGSRADGSSRRR
jgi:hypothetical protein